PGRRWSAQRDLFAVIRLADDDLVDEDLLVAEPFLRDLFPDEPPEIVPSALEARPTTFLVVFFTALVAPLTALPAERTTFLVPFDTAFAASFVALVTGRTAFSAARTTFFVVDFVLAVFVPLARAMRCPFLMENPKPSLTSTGSQPGRDDMLRPVPRQGVST